jgi:WD40 repeat protein
VLSLAFCGPTRLATGGSDNLIRLWDLNKANEALRLVGHTGSVTTLVWDAGTDQLVSGSFDTTVRFWDLKSDRIGDFQETTLAPTSDDVGDREILRMGSNPQDRASPRRPFSFR